MTKPSKFAKPQRELTQDEIERVIGKAESRDEPASAIPEPEAEKEVRFTLALPSGMAGRVDAARKAAGGMARLAWIRLAIAEKLAREGH
jgi:hypothetical protein